MYKFEKSIFIDHPHQKVFDFVTDFTNDLKWQSTLKSVEKVSAGPIGEGTILRYTAKFLGRSIESDIEVTGYDPPNMASTRSINGPVPFENVYLFKPKGDGTEMTIKGQADVGGFFKLAEGLVGKQFEKQIEADSAVLKSLLESEMKAS